MTSLSTTAPRDFDQIYRDAQGDPSKIKWATGRANPLLVGWLDRDACACLRAGSRVAVVGCGLGHDARELIRRGFDVTAFDISPCAIDWAKRLDADCAASFHVADLLELPTRWRRRFDLVVEIYTVQSLPPDTRRACFSALESLLHPHGSLLLVARGAERPMHIDEGPPWPLTSDEVRDEARAVGLEAEGGIEVLFDDEEPPVRRLRGLFRRA